MRLRMMLASALIGTAFCCGTSAEGAFGVSVSGDAVIIDPPSSAVHNATESNKYQVWYEGDTVLARDLHVDYVSRCRDLDEYLSGHKIKDGTCISSYFVHFDPLPTNALFVNPQATLTFDEKILGIAFRDHRLDQSDFLGAPGTTYPTGSNIRGLEFFDFFVVNNGGYSIDLSFIAKYGFDQIRIFTLCSSDPGQPVPEPASMLVWSLAMVVGGGLSWRSRKQRMERGESPTAQMSNLSTEKTA